MSTHTIGLLLAILGGFVPLAKPLPWRIVLTIPPSQTFLFTLLGQNLLAQTPAPSSFPEDRPTPEAKFVTWFHAEREIAFHAYAVPPYPASHGCMRLLTKNRGAEWIYDNTLAGITQVKVDGNPLAASLSPKCWSGDRLILRPTKKSKQSSS